MVLTCKIYFLYLNCTVISYGNVNIYFISVCKLMLMYPSSILLFIFLSFLCSFLLRHVKYFCYIVDYGTVHAIC